MTNLPIHEQSVIDADRPRLERWSQLHPGAAAEVTVEREAFDAGQGHVLLVVSLRNVRFLPRARNELPALVEFPDRLRVRSWRPPRAEAERVMRWIMKTFMGDAGGPQTVVSSVSIDPATGLVRVALDRRDEAFARELRAATNGIVQVADEAIIINPAGES